MSDRASSEIQDLAKRLIEDGSVESVWTGTKETLYSLPELVPYYKATYGKDEKLTGNKENVIVGRLVPDGTVSVTTTWNKQAPKDEKKPEIKKQEKSTKTIEELDREKLKNKFSKKKKEKLN